MAGAVAGLVAAAAAAMAPFAAVRLAVITPFIPMYEMTEILVEGLTAFLLAVQFRATRRAYLGGLAGAYVFVMVTAVIQLLIFPGVFAKDGLLGAGPQSAVWLWGGLACGVCAGGGAGAADADRAGESGEAGGHGAGRVGADGGGAAGGAGAGLARDPA